MRIICLEEHTADADIADASRAAMMRQAGYVADLGSRVGSPSEDEGAARPRLRAIADIPSLLRDVGAGRIADMDANGIDMQILSYSDASQLAPADQAVGLTRAANDRLAEAVRAHPTRFAGLATLPWQFPRRRRTNWTARSANSG